MCTRCPVTISIIFGSPSFPGQFWIQILISRLFFILNDGFRSIGAEFLHDVKIFIIFLMKIVILVTLKVELLKVWKFNCPELGICCQAYFKVKVSPSDQLILLSRIWEKNEKPIKNERFFYISFFWCLASAGRVCRRPRILLSEVRLYESFLRAPPEI